MSYILEQPAMTYLYAHWWMSVGKCLPGADEFTIPQAYQVTRCVALHSPPAPALTCAKRNSCRPTVMT